MKVLILNGSPRADGNTTIAVNEMVKVFETEGIETQIMQIGSQAIRGCIACGSCAKNGTCVFDDVVNEAAKELDIVYLFGHDHSKGWDCYMGGSSVYKAKGDTILIPQFSEEKVNTNVYTEEELRFTYLNAGYVGYYMNCGPEEHAAGEKDLYSAADETLTGTIFEI